MCELLLFKKVKECSAKILKNKKLKECSANYSCFTSSSTVEVPELLQNTPIISVPESRHRAIRREQTRRRKLPVSADNRNRHSHVHPAHVVLVAVEEDSEGLDPGEVAGEVGISFADEVGVDVEVGVGDQTEVGVLLAVEVEGDPVAAHESRVLAHGAGPVAACTRRLWIQSETTIKVSGRTK